MAARSADYSNNRKGSPMSTIAQAHKSHREFLIRLGAANGKECPFCGAREGIEWNGVRGDASAYGCHGGNGCGEQWDAVDWRPTDDELALYGE